MTVKELIEELSKFDDDNTIFSFGIEIKGVRQGDANYLYDNPKDQIIIIY